MKFTSSGIGKTEFILALLKSKMYVDDFELVVYCIPSNTGHLASVKGVIEQLKDLCDSLIVHGTLSIGPLLKHSFGIMDF